MKRKSPVTDCLDVFLCAVVVILGIVVRHLPLKAALGFGSGLGRIGYFLTPGRHRIAFRNLECALKGEGKRYLTAIVRGVYAHLGQNLIEILRFPLLTAGNISGYVKMEGVEHVRDALSEGKGVILLTGHFGNWELAGRAAALRGYPTKVLAREQKFERLNRLLNSYRQLQGCEVVPKGMAMRDIIRHLKQNGIMGMLSDQDGGRRGIFVTFFGRPASTPPGAIAIALRTGASVLPLFITRERGGRHRIRIDPPLVFSTERDERETVRKGLQDFASLLEARVRRHPAQWLWLHNRWKTKP